ncbi:MAG: response regulator receiver protein [Brevundimonas sp.]|nr:response regulator receiver protein [Brevundimonas sp.]
MTLIGQYIETVAPITPDMIGSDVLQRFHGDPDTIALAVVDSEGRPLGLIERNSFTLRMAAEFGRALFGRRPAQALMDTEVLITDAGASAEVLFDRLGDTRLDSRLSCFIVVSNGAYVGIGSALHVIQAGAALHRQRAEEMSDLVRDLAIAEAEATASSRAKSEFLAVMSHEIRTPLNGVLGVAALLERKLEQEELRPYVRTILDSGNLLLRLLTDALDMSRAQAGMILLEEEPTDLESLATDIDALWRARAEEKSLRFEISTTFATDTWVVADGVRLKQVLNNLIGNALKFTQAGEVLVTITSRQVADRVRVDVTVDDSGPGVSESAIAGIFDPFNTGQANRSGAGAGLGLAICRQIVTLMGGEISVAHSPQGGARFQFHVPMTLADPETRIADVMKTEPTPHDTIHVLIVDDNATNRFVASKLLETFGATYQTAENGEEAVALARSNAFDLILMDIKMPVMDGVAATEVIRKMDGPRATTPILALTANADPKDAAAYLHAGMNGVVEKPIQPDVLLEAIRRALTPLDERLAAAA